MSPYAVMSIRADQIDPAYALVVHIEPRLSLDEWRDRCRASIERSGRDASADSIVVVANPQGYIQGLCSVATRQHAAYGRILDVPTFVAASASDEGGVVSSLVEYLEAMAKARRCGRIRIVARGNEDLSSAQRQDSHIMVEHYGGQP